MKTFSVTPKLSITKQLTLLGLLGFACFVVMVVALHVLRPDYNPMSRVISEYAIGLYSPLMTGSFIALSLGSFALVLALARTGPNSSRVALTLLALWSTCVLVLSIFPTDPYGIPVSLSGIIHSLVALLAFLCLLFASLLYSLRFRRDARWHSFTRPSLILAIFIGISLIVFLASPVAFKGITERVLVLVTLVWLSWVALRIVSLRI